MTNDIIDFPKIKSPFVRKKINGHYVVTPEIEKGYEWVFEEEGVQAVDKLHGSCLCCLFKAGILQSIDNRTTRVIPEPCISTNMNSNETRMIEGVINAISRKWIPKSFTGRLYGELVGPSINGNIHLLDEHYFVPFDWLKKHSKWNTWFENRYPKDFESISEWFKDLTSLFTYRMTHATDYAEGLVFYSKDGKLAKIRRDMFSWYYTEKYSPKR